MAPKGPLTFDENIKFLLSIIKNTPAKPDWDKVQVECNLNTLSAARMRLTRLQNAIGFSVKEDDGKAKSTKKDDGQDSGAADHGDGGNPASAEKPKGKKRKAAGEGKVKVEGGGEGGKKVKQEQVESEDEAEFGAI